LKATGIVRRIDELGRVVIPKEIRRTLRIREGDPLEIFTDREGGVILKKYSPIGELFEYAREFTDSINKTLGHTAIICDRDMVVAASGLNKKSYVDAAISEELNSIIGLRQGVMMNNANKKKPIPVINGEDITTVSSEVIAPVLSEGQPIGAVVIMSKKGKQMSEVEEMVAKTASGFMGMQMEQ
jgi:AbrB family transcriptional regulator, stage V sporulation protein T